MTAVAPMAISEAPILLRFMVDGGDGRDEKSKWCWLGTASKTRWLSLKYVAAHTFYSAPMMVYTQSWY
jgi:hypothetical protein